MAVAVCVFLPRFARLMAGWMLCVFVAVLAAEIARGATSCGCLGAWSPPPWVMLAIDGSLATGQTLR